MRRAVQADSGEIARRIEQRASSKDQGCPQTSIPEHCFAHAEPNPYRTKRPLIRVQAVCSKTYRAR